MIMNEEPVCVAISQSTQMIEETLAANMRRLKSGQNNNYKRRDIRKKRSPREGGDHSFQKFYPADDNSYNRHIHIRQERPPFHCPSNHINQQQQQQQQQQPTSPVLITPPISSSNHPLSSYQTTNQPPSTSHPLFMCPSQLQMPMPMQYPMPMPLSMPPVNYDGQMPLQVPIQMPISMPNMPLPILIRLPAQPCVSPSTSNSSEDNFKFNASPSTVGGHSSTINHPHGATVVNFIPLMFPHHFSPMLFGPSQPMMVTPMLGSHNFHQMVNEGQGQLLATHQQSHSSTK